MSLVVDVNFDALVFVVSDIALSKNKKEINKAFDEIVTSESSSRDHETGFRESISGGYQRSIKIPIPNKNIRLEPKYFHIYVEPYASAKAYVKVALMKHPYARNDYQYVNQTLRWLFKYCQRDYLSAVNLRVIKVDIAFDKKVDITNLWFNNPRTQVAMQVFGKSGKYETTYLGDNRAVVRIRIYDKAAQLKSKRHKHQSYHALLRVEFSIRPNSRIDQLIDDIDIVSKLDKFSIYKSKPIKKAGIFSKEICSLIDYVGIKSILQSMDQSRRRRALKKMEPFRSNLISKNKLRNKLNSLNQELEYLYEK